MHIGTCTANRAVRSTVGYRKGHSIASYVFKHWKPTILPHSICNPMQKDSRSVISIHPGVEGIKKVCVMIVAYSNAV